MTHDRINALGFVEVRGLAAAIETADCMLKSAEVRLLRNLLRDPAQNMITVEGELGACRAAVDAGQARAKHMGAFVASHVIGRPANDTADFVLRLAEAGGEPFAQKSSSINSRPSFSSEDLPTAAQENTENARLLAALSELRSGCGAQRLARRVGGDVDSVRQCLEALCASGKLVKRHGRYVLIAFSGDDK